MILTYQRGATWASVQPQHHRVVIRVTLRVEKDVMVVTSCDIEIAYFNQRVPEYQL